MVTERWSACRSTLSSPWIRAKCCSLTDISYPPIWPHHWCAHQLTLVTSVRKDCVQGHSADLPGTARWCPSVPTAVYISHRRSPTSLPNKDFGLPPRTICAFLLSDCLLLDVVLSLSLVLARVWNALPADVTSAPSLFTFRTLILALSSKLTFLHAWSLW